MAQRPFLRRQIDTLAIAPRRRVFFAGGALVLTVLFAYANSLSAPFLWDDLRSIANNPTIRSLSTSWSPPAGTTVSGRPILNFSLALNYALGRDSVAGYHALNLAIHILAGLAVLGIVRRTLQQPALRGRYGSASVGLALAVALVWALHPLQTESVTYVIQRAESLMGLFYLLTLYCFIRFSAFSPGAPEGKELGRSPWAGLSILACLLGAATKEVMVSAPLMVLLYDRTFVAGTFKDAFRLRRWFYAGLATSWLLLLGLVAWTGGNRGGSIGFGIGVPWWKYALTQFKAVSTYLSLSIWPHPLVFDRGTAWVRGPMDVLPYAIVVLAALAGTAIALKRRPAVGFLGCWFFLILAPTSSIVPGTTQMIVEHRMYLPLAAVVAFAVIGAYAVAGWRSMVAFLALSLLLGLATSARNEDYRSALALWRDTVASRPDNEGAQLTLADELAKLPDRRPEAVAHYEQALRINPNYAEAHNNLAVVLEGIPGRLPEALAHYEAALRINPDYAEAHYNLATALAGLPGRLPEALAHYEAALRINPDYAQAHNNMAVAIAEIPGRLPEALAHYEAALRINPDYAEAHYNLANALVGLPGRLPEALAHYEAALRINPNNAPMQNNIAAVYANTGHIDEAIAHLELAHKLDPSLAEARENLRKLRAIQR